MNKYLAVVLVIGLLVLSSTLSAQEKYTGIEWFQLMPKDDLEALLNPPDFIMDIQEGAENDDPDLLKKNIQSNLESKRFEQALNSTRIISDFAGKAIRIPGFVVPIESNEQQRATTFFIVPYFGACLHMPPPPPNQIIFAKSSNGVELTSLYDAFWFEGILEITTTEHPLGKSAYSLKLDKVSPYDE